jgi:hypothetical protein
LIAGKLPQTSGAGWSNVTTESSFFPPDTFPASYAEWYCRFLCGLKEPRLQASDGTEYRFLWLRTFHEPIAIRAIQLSGSAELIVKQSDGQGGYDVGNVTVNKSRPLTIDEWARITEEVEAIKFWSIPTGGEESGCDGAQWVIEGVCNGQYHAVHRWSNKAIQTFGTLCELLVGLSGLSVSHTY